MLKLHFLGTGDGTAQKDKKNTSLLLEFDEQAILIDCSGLPVQAIQLAGCNLDKINDVILTHSHIDHIYALPSLLHSLWLRKDKDEYKKIRIHGLKETLSYAETLIKTFKLRSKPFPLDIESVRIRPKLFKPEWNRCLNIEIPDWELTGFPVSHGSTPAIGIETKNMTGQRILFSGDAVVDKVIVSLIKNQPQYLIHDCGGGLEGNTGHAGAIEINKLIRDTSVSKVYLTHLPELTQEEANRIVEVVSDGFAGQVIVPQDGLLVSVS